MMGPDRGRHPLLAREGEGPKPPKIAVLIKSGMSIDGVQYKAGDIVFVHPEIAESWERTGWVEVPPDATSDAGSIEWLAELYQRLVDAGIMSKSAVKNKLDDAYYDAASSAIHHSNGTITTAEELQEMYYREMELRDIRARWQRARQRR
jgi:hypothetical protein